MLLALPGTEDTAVTTAFDSAALVSPTVAGNARHEKTLMLPMGTIMTACMALGVLFANRLPWIGLNRASPRPLLLGVGSVVALAGLWNVGWYALRHLGEFWGNAALVSGALMLLVAAYLTVPTRLPRTLVAARPFVVFALLGFALLYGVTIYRL